MACEFAVHFRRNVPEGRVWGLSPVTSCVDVSGDCPRSRLACTCLGTVPGHVLRGRVWGRSPDVAPGGRGFLRLRCAATVDTPGLLTPWLLGPVPIALAAVAAACFARGFVRLRRRGRPDHA